MSDYMIVFKSHDIGDHHSRYNHLDDKVFWAGSDKEAIDFVSDLVYDIEKDIPDNELWGTDTCPMNCVYRIAKNGLEKVEI